MLQHNRWLRRAGLSALLPLFACSNEGTGSRDITPWSRLLPSEAGQSVVAMALDAQGEPALAGALMAGIDDSFTRPDGNGQGVFLSMFDSTGKGLWGGSTRAPNAQARGVAVAPNGDVLVLGSFLETIDLGGPLLMARNNSSFPEAMFLARFDPRGKLLWSEAIDDVRGQPPHGMALATNADGDAILGGYILSQLDYSGQDHAGFIARFDADGDLRWSQLVEGLSSQVNAVTVDAAGSIYAAGSDFGSTPVGQGQPVVTQSAFIAKLSPEGVPVFTTRISSVSANDVPYIESLAVDASGDVAFSGVFGNDVSFGPTIFTVLGGTEAFVAAVSARTGEPHWLTPIKVPYGRAEVVAVALAPNGRVYATGQYQGDELTVDGLTLGPTSGKAMFLVEIDAAGKALDARIFDHAGQLSVGRALAFDPAGALVLAGHFVGQVDLDDQQLTSALLGSSFVARLGLPFASHRRE